MRAPLGLRAAALSLLIFGAIVLIWQVAAQPSGGATTTVDPEYAKLVGAAAATGQKSAIPTPADIASSQVQVTFMPPVHFSIFMVQCGTIIMFMPAGIVAAPPIIPVPMPGVPMPVMLIPARSINLVIIPNCSLVPREIARRSRHRYHTTCRSLV